MKDNFMTQESIQFGGKLGSTMFSIYRSLLMLALTLTSAAAYSNSCETFETEGVDVCLENNFQIYKVKIGATLTERANIPGGQFCDPEGIICKNRPAIIYVTDNDGVRRYTKHGPITAKLLVAQKTLDLGQFVGKVTVDIKVKALSVPYNATMANIRLVVQNGSAAESTVQTKEMLLAKGSSIFTMSQSLDVSGGPLTLSIYADSNVSSVQSPFSYVFEISDIQATHYIL